jgi:spore maturation protein CgeB
VCFLGSVQGYNDRIIGIEALKFNGIEVVHMGGQRENPLPLDAYVGVLQRSKICLSFPKYRGAPYIQAKGRIFEATLCGALLMDADNEQTKKWFVPNEHYISFTDERDLVEKVKYYLSNDTVRGTIAQAGWLKSSISYSPRNFWKTILERVGL